VEDGYLEPKQNVASSGTVKSAVLYSRRMMKNEL